MVASREPFDVAIAGGGLAGNLLARQLRRAAPELRVGLFERTSQTSYKVGEATVEIASNYLIRRQGLSHYLYENQLPKNGLRYFFDNAERDAPLEQMSEIGSTNLPFHPAFQLDRARLEADLLDMNRRDGVQVRTGAAVGCVELGTRGEPHRFEVTSGGRTTACESRWLVDASGRSGLIARLQGLKVPEATHRLGSVWGRFEGVADIDQTGSEAFRARVRHTSRRLSTIHFWYPGYWIWFIPLRGGTTSVGATGDAIARSKELRTPEGFRAFLDEHRAVRELLAGAKSIDIGSYTQIAYGTSRFFHPDRWGLTGEAATSADPLYSPGSDFIALENDYLSDLIRRDLVDGERAELAERCELYDRFMQFRHEATMRLYRNLYAPHGSFELARAKWDFDIALYYNLWVSPYMRDEHLDRDYLAEQLRLRPLILQALENFSLLFRRVEAALRERGDYFRANTGEFHYGLANIDFERQVGCERSADEALQKTEQIFNGVRAQALELLGELASERGVEPLPLKAFLGRRGID
ncbi:MAG TPA: FAD-dependent monooxygenase [Myxococcota bacterium]|nr:FAD-dependent monooxygenase [Myxococcota bacterium]